MVKFVKVYIEIIAKFDLDGRILPQKIIWQDGIEYKIDKIGVVKQAPPDKVGGYLTVRYECYVNGILKIIYLETSKNKWFLEKEI